MKQTFRLLLAVIMISGLLVPGFGVQESKAENAQSMVPETETLVLSETPAGIDYDYTVDHEDGGKSYIYEVNGLRVEIPVPPADFEPLNATDEKLAEYGMPERPSASETDELAEWEARMARYSGHAGEPDLSVGLAVEDTLNGEQLALLAEEAADTLASPGMGVSLLAAGSYSPITRNTSALGGYYCHNTSSERWDTVTAQYVQPANTSTSTDNKMKVSVGLGKLDEDNTSIGSCMNFDHAYDLFFQCSFSGTRRSIRRLDIPVSYTHLAINP